MKITQTRRIQDIAQAAQVVQRKTEDELNINDIAILVSRGRKGSPSDADIIGRYFDKLSHVQEVNKAIDKNGNTILHLLVEKSNEQNKPENNQKCYNEYALIVHDLIANYGANPTLTNQSNHTALQLAVRQKNKDILKQMDDGAKDWQDALDVQYSKEKSAVVKNNIIEDKSAVIDWLIEIQRIMNVFTHKEDIDLLIKMHNEIMTNPRIDKQSYKYKVQLFYVKDELKNNGKSITNSRIEKPDSNKSRFH